MDGQRTLFNSFHFAMFILIVVRMQKANGQTPSSTVVELSLRKEKAVEGPIWSRPLRILADGRGSPAATER